MFETEVKIQKFLGIRKTKEEWRHNEVFYGYFKIFTELGSLNGYILAVVLNCAWLYYKGVQNGNLDPKPVYGYCHVWVWSLLLAELIKALLKLPRPDPAKNADLFQHEKAYIVKEYGPPSTHVVGVMTSLQPLLAPYGLPAYFLLLISTSLSRLYFGVHTIFCVISGSAIGLFASIYHTEIATFFTEIPPIFNYGALLVLMKIFPARSPDEKLAKESATISSYVATVSFMASIFQLTELAYRFIYQPISYQLALLAFFIFMIYQYRSETLHMCLVINCIIHISLRGFIIKLFTNF